MLGVCYQAFAYRIRQDVLEDSRHVFVAPSDVVVVAALPERSSVAMSPSKPCGKAFEALHKASEVVSARFWRERHMQVIRH